MNYIGFIIFDIDGVIRDVGRSYRLAIKKTVSQFCGWEPNSSDIDKLKHEGIWNNDWDLSLELIKRYIQANKLKLALPSRNDIIKVFENLYFGCDPKKDYKYWNGFIKNEELLVDKIFFDTLNINNIGWGFVSGAERISAKFVLENILKLKVPPLIAMGDAPDKPNPNGFISLAKELSNNELNALTPPIVYVGDTIADIKTVINARLKIPEQKFISVGVVPPHLQSKIKSKSKQSYESALIDAGADYILQSTKDIKNIFSDLFPEGQFKRF